MEVLVRSGGYSSWRTPLVIEVANEDIDDPRLHLARLRLALIEGFGDRWKSLYADVPRVLYHYTNTEGFDGILRSASLRASNALYLNDDSELSYIFEVLSEAVETASGSWTSDAARKFFFEVRQGLRSQRRVYLACFCESGDLLSQWRGYGSGQGGLAIGFHGESLRRSNDPAGHPLYLRPVIYDHLLQRQLVGFFVETLSRALDRVSEIHGDAAAHALVADSASVAIEELQEAVFCFKNPGFAEEKEWRLVLSETPDPSADDWADYVEFRPGRGTLIPYVSLDLRRDGGDPNLLPIDGAVVGPSPFGVLAWHAARGLFQQRGYTAPKPYVERSRISLRA